MLEEERGTVGGLRRPAPPAVLFLLTPENDDDGKDEDHPVPFLRSSIFWSPCVGGGVCMSGGVDSVVREMMDLPLLLQWPVTASFFSASPRPPLSAAFVVIL